MQQQAVWRRPWLWALAAAALLLIPLWPVVTTLAMQLFAAFLLMALALPVCRWLEKRLSPSLAASLSFIVLTLALLLFLLLLIPPLIGQLSQLSEAVPGLMASGQTLLEAVSRWLTEQGIDLTQMRDSVMTELGGRAAGLLSQAAARVSALADTLGKLFLAPLFAFYLLRDRRRLSASLTLLIPVRWRAQAVRAAREMRRETAGFVRGQLLVSAFVGLLTAGGLALVGTPGWLVLGLVMGVMELIPYLGPILAGIPAVLLALPGGLPKALWTLGVLIAVQQLEGGLLSPRLLSGATRLHPLWVLLAISAGGLIGGTLGMLLSLPVVVSVRGALRGLRAP